MNAKKAKALRRLMKNMAQQSPEMPVREYAEITSRAKYIYVQGDEIVKAEKPELTPSIHSDAVEVPSEAKKPEKVKVATGQIINGSNSRRALYRHLKGELRKVEAARK